MARRKRRAGGRAPKKTPKKRKPATKPPAPVVRTPEEPAPADITADAFNRESQAEQARLDRVRAAIRRRQAGEILRKQEINDIDWFERRVNAVRAKKHYSTMTYQEFLQLVALPKTKLSRWMDRGLAKTKNDDGSWNLFKFLDWAVPMITLREAPADGDGDAAADQIADLNLRMKIADTQQKEYELKVMRGELQAEFEALLEKVLVPIIAARVAQAQQVAPRLVGKTEQEIEAELSMLNRAYVEELRQGRPGIPTDVVDRVNSAMKEHK